MLFAFSIVVFVAATIAGVVFHSYKNYGLTPNLELHALSRANRLKSAGWFDDALTEYRVSAAIQPGNGEALYNMVLAAEAKGDVDTAVWALQELVRYFPDDPMANRSLGRLYTNLNQYGLAIEHLQHAARLLQGDQAAMVYADLARTYDLNRQPKLAAQSRQKAVELRSHQ